MVRARSGASCKPPSSSKAAERKPPSLTVPPFPRREGGRGVRSLSSLDLLILLGFLAVALAFFAPLFLPGAWHRWIVEGDFSHQFFPFRAFEAQEWWRGRIPLWNPDMFGGHPFEADVQTAVFYPFALANAILWGWRGLPYLGLEGEVVLHTWLAGVFTYLLARRLTGSRLGGIVAGLAFAFGGFITTYPAQQLPILETAIWLPLIVLGLHQGTEGRVLWPWLLGASGALGLALLAGHTQTALFMAYAAEGYLLFRLIRERLDWRRGLLALVAFPGVSVLVASIQVLPSLQLLQVSTRDKMDYLTAAHAYLPSALWEVFVPLWHDEKALSIGVVALLLAAVGAVAGRREPLVYWAAIALIALPLSTGGSTPLFWVMYHVAPGWNLFRDQERVIYLFSFGAALLAGRGMAELQRRGGGFARRWGAVAGLGGALALALFVAAFALHAPRGLALNLGLDAVVLGLLAAALVLYSQALPLAAPRWAPAALVALVLVEAFALNFGNNLSATNPDPRPRLAATAAFLQPYPEPFRVDVTSETVLPSDYGSLLSLPMVGGDTPFELRRVHELLTPDSDWHLWQILNVKFVIGDPVPNPGLKLAFEDNGLKTYQMTDSLPRAWAVRAVEVASSADQAKRLILAPGYHPGNVVVLEGRPSIGPFVAGPRPDVKITRLTPQEVDLDATADGNAMLILASQYYPGWQAYRDGQPIQTFTANYVAMAFELPPGAHHFEIVYRPTAFYLGAALSGLGILLILLVIYAAQSLAARTRICALLGLGPRREVGPEHDRRGRLAYGLAAGLLILLGFGLRVHALGAPNLTGDEWFMLRNHDEGVAWIVHQARTFEPHPLLYYLGLTGWIELAGRSEFALRVPSVWFDVLLVPTLIGLGRVALGRRAALLAGGLAAINPYQLVESQNARNYAMVTGLSALATLLLLRALRRNRRRDWLAYGVAMLLALNTHYNAALVLAAHGAFLGVLLIRSAWSGRLGKAWSAWGRSALTTLIVVMIPFAVMVVYALPGLRAYHGYFPDPVGIDLVLGRSLATFSLGATAPTHQALPLFLLGALGLGWLALRRPNQALLFGLAALLPFAIAGVLFLFRPMFDERYLIVAAPAYLILLAAGLDAFAAIARPVGVGGALAALLVIGPWVPRTYATAQVDRPDYRAMAGWVASYGEPSDPIVATGHGQAELFSYYDRGPRPPVVIDDPSRLRSELPGLLPVRGGLWLLPYAQDAADQAAFATLGPTAAFVDDRWFENARALYYTSTAGLGSSTARGSFDDALSLDQARISGQPILTGNAAAAELHWTVRQAMPTPKVSLRLLDLNGAVVAQHDVALTGAATLTPGPLVTRVGLFVPLVAPPGRYQLAVLLYHPADGSALHLAGPSASPDNLLLLGDLTVQESGRTVPPTEYGVPRTALAAMGAGLSLLGRDPLPGEVTSGDWLTFRLLWQAERAALPDLQRTIDFRSVDGRIAGSSNAPILASYPTSRWTAGQVLAENTHLQVPPSLPRGAYEVFLRVGAGPSLSLGKLAVNGPDRSFARPDVPKAIGVRFGGFAMLLGIDPPPGTVAPGGTAHLTLIWQAAASADRSYTVFVHLVGPDGKLHGQIDRPPVGGTRPTTGWMSGEFLRDGYAPSVSPDAPAGTYQVEVGMYDPASGARVPLTLAGGTSTDHVVVATVEVRR